MRLLIAQLNCPVTTDLEAFLASAKTLQSATGFHLYNGGGGLSPLALGSFLREELDKEIYVHMHLADRNRAALFSDLITGSVLGLEKIILSVGPHPAKTAIPGAKAVFDLDLLQFLRLAQRAKAGLDPAGAPMGGGPTSLQIGVSAKVDSPLEWLRLRQMVELGADFVFLKWPSKQLSLSQLPGDLGRPIYLSLELGQAEREDGLWDQIRQSGIVGINCYIPEGQMEKGEEFLSWCSHYLSSESS